MSTDKTEQALPDYIPMDHEAMASIHLPGDVISDTKARQQYARNVERKAVDYYKAQLRAALTAAPPAQPVSYHRDDDPAQGSAAYAQLAARLDAEGRRTLANAVSHGARATLASDGAVILSRKDWAELRTIAAPPAQPQEPVAIVEQAFRDGYCARSTYNDKDTSDVDDEWLKAKPHFAAMLADSPPRAVEPLTDEHAWISVDDKLPETPGDGSDVPVYVWDGELVSEDDYAEQWEQPAGPMVGGWIQTGWDFMSNSRLGKPQVTHWCHRRAPQPPQE